MNYPMSNNESERLAALHRLKILETEPTAEFDAVVAIAAAILDAPIALISFMDEDVQWFKARVGLDEYQTSRDSAFCNYTILTNELLEVEDARQDERFRHNCFVTGHLGIRYYLGVPISLDGETNIATLCVLDTKPRKATNPQLFQLEQLKIIVRGLILTHSAAIEAKITERDARQRGKLLAQVERISKIGAWSLNTDSLISEWSPQVFKIHELSGNAPPILAEALSFYPDYERERVSETVRACIESGIPYEIETDFITANGNKKRVRASAEIEHGDDDTKYLIGIFQDITDKYEQQKKLWHAAHFDSLTGIANRFSFQSEIERRLCNATAEAVQVALLMIDLDNFKNINDDLGHLAGDAVLRKVAERIVQSSSEDTFCARLGGDEFAVLWTIRSTLTAQEFALSLLEELNAPIVYENHEIQIGASIGLAACAPDGIAAADELILKSDLALYHAKQNSPGKLQIYEPAITSAYEEKRSAVLMVKSAVKDARLVPYYQPIVDLGTNEIRGVEALARIRKVDGTISGPGDFWHAFSEPQCAREIDELMFDLALKDFAHWRSRGFDIDFISVNASAASIQSEGFAARVLNGLAGHGLSPRDLKIEIVESVFLGHDGIDVGDVLEQLSRKGVLIALDDFGTGYASLSHLRDYPIDCIKIDKSFVLGLGRAANNTAIVQALIGLGQSMKLDVIAEGIETSDQLDFVSALGSNYGQGYLFSKPIDAENTALLLTKQGGAKPKRLV